MSPPSVWVAAVGNEVPWSRGDWSRVRAGFDPGLIVGSKRFRRWQDRQAHLLGRLLLQYLLPPELQPHATTPNALAPDRYGRPFLTTAVGASDPPMPDFNISHTDGLVVCALAWNRRVGIDVERRLPLRQLTDFRRVFTPEEYEHIKTSRPRENAFYRLWTRKEAVMKADGRGFYLDPKQINALPQHIRIAERTYYVQPLWLSDMHAAHLADTQAGARVRVRRLTLADVLTIAR